MKTYKYLNKTNSWLYLEIFHNPFKTGREFPTYMVRPDTPSKLRIAAYSKSSVKAYISEFPVIKNNTYLYRRLIITDTFLTSFQSSFPEASPVAVTI